MPRPRTVQPEPLETFTFTDDDGQEVVVEVRDESCWEIGRGLHKRNASQKRKDTVLELVADDYFTSKGRKFVSTEKDYLANASKFARQVELWGLGGDDDSASRKDLYPYIKKHIDALEQAILAKQLGTSCAQEK